LPKLGIGKSSKAKAAVAKKSIIPSFWWQTFGLIIYSKSFVLDWIIGLEMFLELVTKKIPMSTQRMFFNIFISRQIQKWAWNHTCLNHNKINLLRKKCVRLTLI
jgi:hypothetical protein